MNTYRIVINSFIKKGEYNMHDMAILIKHKLIILI